MILLKRLEVWVTGSTLNKEVKKLRVKLFIVSAILLLAVFIFSLIAAGQVYDSVTPKDSIDGILRSRLNSARVDKQTIDTLRESLEEQRKERFFDSLFVSNSFLYFIILFILWFGLYFILKPLSKSIDDKEKFLKHASHDLRTPLAILSSSFGLVDKKTKKDDLLEVIEDASNEVKRMQVLANSYLNKLTNKKNNQIKISLKKEILDVIKILKINTQIEVKVEDNYILEVENIESFRQLLYNLIDNMNKYSDGNNIIKRNDKYLVFSNDIKNTRIKQGVGIGICKDLSKELGFKYKAKINKNRYEVCIIFKQ